MKLNKKIKSLLILKNELALYGLSIDRNLERLEKDMEKLDLDNPSNFSKAILEGTENKEHRTVIKLAETVETIFLKTRHMLTKFPLDTVAQERLETLGVNFDIDTGTVVQIDNFKEIN